MDTRPVVEIVLDLSAIGPDTYASWAELNNIGKLCSRCQAVDWDPVKMYLVVADGYTEFPKIPLYSAYPTLAQLRAAAHEGCHLCTLILTCLTSARYESSHERILGLGVPATFSVNDKTVIKIDVEVMAHPMPVWLTVEIDHCPAHLSGMLSRHMPIKGSIVTTSCPVQFSSPAEDIARFWLEDCCVTHELCKSETPLLPKRVVDVVSGLEPFLFITQCQPGRYAALSYCFGIVPVLTTTGKTLHERQASIPMTFLPQTVRDAVIWTRQLGLQYLWIDSLCILQDSQSDWEVELSTMADIYRDATVTIAATAAQHAGSGCSPVRNKLQLAPFTPLPGIAIEADFGRDAWIFRAGPLEKRGWAFQEIQLSRRVLRCGGEELAWQCRTHSYLESVPGRSVYPNTINRDASPRTTLSTRPLDDTRNMDSFTTFQRWYQMVEAFSSRKLTYLEDKMPAFSGIARHFAQHIWQDKDPSLITIKSEYNTTLAQGIAAPPKSRPPFRYLCGLWHNNFLQGLLWRCVDPGSPIPYRGPTWSWVSRESRIKYNTHRLRTDDFSAQVLDVDVTVPGLNPYGRVSSGKVTMLGSAAPIPSGACEDESGTQFKKHFRHSLYWDLEGAPQLGCILFKLHEQNSLILAPEKRCHAGTYRRVGLVGCGTTGLAMDMLNTLDWQEEVVTII
jgi:Heterokaryon incompatibility protein (HET)